MARALENLAITPTYLEFFGMNRAPFARVSEPIELFHAEQYSALYAHLCSATEVAGHLLVISGAAGSGKTTLLNRYIASLNHETSYATFDENCPDPNVFYCGLLRQLGFKDISGKLNELRHIARKFLLHRGRFGDPVLIIVDNAPLVSAAVLEQLRWLGEITVDDKHVISLVLSGNADLSRIMASPAMRLLKLPTRVDFSIRVLSEEETGDYVRHRLRLAGGSESAKLSKEARPLIHRFSGGNPRRINRFCNAILSEALSRKTRILDEALVRKVADDHKFVPHVLPIPGKGRRQSDTQVLNAIPEAIIEERISRRESPSQQAATEFADSVEQDEVGLDVEGLLSQVTLLNDALDESRARAEKVLLDVDTRDSDIRALIGKVEQQAKELAQADRKTRDSAEQLQQLKDIVQQGELQTRELQDALTAEKSARRKAQDALSKAEQRLQRLELRKSELQESVRNLKRGQKKNATQAQRSQEGQQKKITELEQRIVDLQQKNESLRAMASEVDRLEQELACKELHLKELQGEINEYVDELTATDVQLLPDKTAMLSATTRAESEPYVGAISAIEVFSGDQLDHVVTLRPGLKRLMVGRGADNEICLKSKFVSRHHALIYLSGERAYVEDLRSYNGTIVNSIKTTQCDLNPDDTISIGDFELRPRRG